MRGIKTQTIWSKQYGTNNMLQTIWYKQYGTNTSITLTLPATQSSTTPRHLWFIFAYHHIFFKLVMKNIRNVRVVCLL